MTANTEQERADFDRLILETDGMKDTGIGWADRNPDGTYKHKQIQKHFLTWQAARRAQVVLVISEAQVLAITTAYEQGVGKGHQSHARKEAITNPYGDEWGCDSAWQMGYDEGRDQAERKAAPQPPEATVKDSLTVEAAPVQMPEPWGHCVGGNVFVSRNLPAHIKPMVDSGEFKDIKLYTEQQVRQLLAAHGTQEQST